ncbi:hypothetical protein V5799_032089 [Amblyomma americanum]|uniref:PiggyBac transposable element-derived protein domain-containing protein n=1 Tax=Amblyomma americanum TaxID=6943 RepID=A0AAQ4DS63_AMBAM
MADGAGDGSEGATIPTALFYSARRLPRSRRPRLEDPDIIFAALGNGDISDIDDDEEEVDEAGELDDAVDGDWDNQQELSDSSDEEEPDKESAREYGSWCRIPFEKPAAEFKPVADENESYRDPLLTPYEYFSKYVPKSVFIELADKTNTYSVFQDGKSVLTNEEEIRKLIALHLTMGVLRYPRLRMYWKPSMKTELLASVNMCRNRFEKLRNCLHIVDVNGDHNNNDRLWKAEFEVSTEK